MAGVLLVTYLPASSDKGLTYTLISFVIVVLGGLGRLVGAWVGALLVGVASSLGLRSAAATGRPRATW